MASMTRRTALASLAALPAWALAAGCFGLIGYRHELAGPVLVWCRVDVVGIVVTMAVLPTAALLAWRARAAPAVVALRTKPWRGALLQASLAPLGLLPLPMLLPSMALLGSWSWRRETAPRWLTAATGAALLAWPWPGVVDALTAATMLGTALLLRPEAPGQRPWLLLASAAALLAAVRALSFG